MKVDSVLPGNQEPVPISVVPRGVPFSLAYGSSCVFMATASSIDQKSDFEYVSLGTGLKAVFEPDQKVFLLTDSKLTVVYK